jgi:hypothetical protein
VVSDLYQIETDKHGTISRLKIAKPFGRRGFDSVDKMKDLFVRRLADIVPQINK